MTADLRPLDSPRPLSPRWWPLDVAARGQPARIASLAACATLAVWFAVYERLQPGTFFDESAHLSAIQAIARGDYRLHPELPMFPGYHWVAYLASLPVGVSLTAARLTTLGFAFAGVMLYSATRNRLFGPDPYAPLRFAFLPLLFPFTAMAYTDVSSIALVLGAVWALSRDRPIESSVWLAAACAVRQTNVVWALFLAGWVVLERWPRRDEIAGRVAGYTVVVAACLALFVWLGRVQAYPVEGQEVLPNDNHLYVLGPLVLVLWLPVWLSTLSRDARALRETASSRRLPAVLGFAAALTVAAWLVLRFRIVHGGNNFTGYFIRNEPLLWMQDVFTLRVLGVVLPLLAAYLVARFVWQQSQRDRLILICFTGAIAIAPLGLVEPRYYLVPMVLFGLLAQVPAHIERRLVAWQGVLCFLVAITIAHDWLW